MMTDACHKALSMSTAMIVSNAFWRAAYWLSILSWNTKLRRRQDSNLRGQSPVDFGSTPLTAWVRLLRAARQKVEMQGIDPCTSRMLSERSTI